MNQLEQQKRDWLETLTDAELYEQVCQGKEKYPELANWPLLSVIDANMPCDISSDTRETLINKYVQVSVPTMKVVGVTFHDNHPQTFSYEKKLTNKQIIKYETSYLLRAEPDNPYDVNAIGVHVKTKDGSYHQVGHLSAAFAADHHLYGDLTVPGTFTDYSNGLFKNVSYLLTVDLESPEFSSSSEYTSVSEDLLADPALYEEEPCTSVFTYERPFALSGPVHDVNQINARINQEDGSLADHLNADLALYEEEPVVLGYAFRFEKDGSGYVCMTTKVPMTTEGMTVAHAFTDYILTARVGSHIRRDGLADIPINRPVFQDISTTFAFVSEESNDLPDLEFGEQLSLSEFGLDL